LQDFTLSIYEGQIFGLLGPNGAGKTTLISMLCGLVKPTSGSFTIEGLSYSQHPTKIKEIIGVVPQEYALYPTLTAQENLMYFGSMYGLSGKTSDKSQRQSRDFGIEQICKQAYWNLFGRYETPRKPDRGIMHQPKLLFLDEPTVGVDVHSRNVIIEYLKQLNAMG
jgi:ABC-2 type transport system ATP-binding protein